MKKFLKTLAVFAAVAALGFGFASCADDDDGGSGSGSGSVLVAFSRVNSDDETEPLVFTAVTPMPFISIVRKLILV